MDCFHCRYADCILDYEDFAPPPLTPEQIARREHRRQKNQQWMREHPELCREYDRRYYAKHRAALIDKQRARERAHQTPENIAAGERLRALRKSLGLTQKQMGALLGRTQTAIGRYERGLAVIPEEIWRKAEGVRG